MLTLDHFNLSINCRFCTRYLTISMELIHFGTQPILFLTNILRLGECVSEMKIKLIKLNGKNKTGLSTGNNKNGKQIAKICADIRASVHFHTLYIAVFHVNCRHYATRQKGKLCYFLFEKNYKNIYFPLQIDFDSERNSSTRSKHSRLFCYV